MRIAVIGARSALAGKDGLQQTLRELCPRLALRGHEIDVFSEPNGRSFQPIDGARVIRLPSFGFGATRASGHALMSSLVSATRGYDIVNFCSGEASGLFNLASKLGLHRTVVSVHGLDRTESGSALPLLGAEVSAARFADAITVVSRGLERHFRDIYGRETIYIPNGITPRTQPINTALPSLLGLPPGGYVLMADRLVPGSGVLDAVMAANVVPGGCHLVVAETGDADPAYRARVVRAADPGRVMLLGHLDARSLDALMAHAYLFLVAAIAEHSTPTLLQALGHGRAVMVSDAAEHVDILCGDGFTFTTGDARDLLRVLTWLIHDRPVVTQMEQRTARAVVSRYCWDRIVESYEQVFMSVL